jgi:hypothetical protein
MKSSKIKNKTGEGSDWTPNSLILLLLLHENIEDDNNALPHLQMKTRTSKGWALVLGCLNYHELGWLLGLYVVAKLHASRGIKLLNNRDLPSHTSKFGYPSLVLNHLQI